MDLNNIRRLSGREFALPMWPGKVFRLNQNCLDLLGDKDLSHLVERRMLVIEVSKEGEFFDFVTVREDEIEILGQATRL